MNPTQFLIYARKSTDDADRQIRSIADQLAEVRELAAKRSLEIVDILLEKQSAKRPGRPVFNAMLDRVERGEAAGILAWHPDRLARNMSDGGRILDMLDRGVIQDLKFPIFDFQNNAQGKLMLAMLFGMSKYYVDSLSDNIKRGQRQKVKNGIWPMVAPVGYLNDKKARIIVPDAERAPLVRKVFELYATGKYTLDQLSQTMAELGLTNSAGTKHKGNPLSRTQYHRLLQNPLYYGTICCGGEHYEGKHEPIVAKSLFDACQVVLERKSQPKLHEIFKPYLYRGLFRCGECGCFVTTETQKGHNYLRCTKRVKDCSQPYLREENLTDEITSVLASAAVPNEWADWMIRQLEADKTSDAAAAAEAEQAIRNDVQAIDTKLDRLMVGYLDNFFGANEYRERKNNLIAEKQELNEKLATLAENRASRFEPAINFVLELKQARIVASQGSAEEKRDFLKKVGSNLEIVNRTLRFVPRQAWQLVVDSGRLAHQNTAPVHPGAADVGETDQNFNEAERPGHSEPPSRKV